MSQYALNTTPSLRLVSCCADLLDDPQSLPESASERRMQEGEEEERPPPQQKPFDPNFIGVFSALYDPVAGEV